jgi:hypothetical protein
MTTNEQTNTLAHDLDVVCFADDWAAAPLSKKQVAELERILRQALGGQRNPEEIVMDIPELQKVQLRLVRTWNGRHSELREYHSNGPHRKSIVVKQLTRWKNAEQAERSILEEASTLRRISSLNWRLRETVPVPLAALPKAKTLVLQKLSGIPLSQILKARANWATGPVFAGQTCRLAHGVGQWLRLFHNATGQGEMTFDAALYLDALESRIQRCRAGGADGQMLDKVASLAEGACRGAHGKTMAAAARQGDFLPQNLLVSERGIAVVDFENAAERDAAYEDVATFLAYLALLRASPFYSERTLQRMEVSFGEGYGGSGDPVLLNLYLIKAAVTIFSEFLPSPQSRGRRKRRARMEVELRRIAERLTGSGTARVSQHR